MKTESIEILEKNNLKSDLKKEETSGCCGGAPTNTEEACCKLDEDKKAEGEEGCGCNTSDTTAKSASKCC